MRDYTKGPWHADLFGNITKHIPRKGFKLLLPTTGIIGTVKQPFARSSVEVHANANLIAASPDLYEALEAMLAESKRQTWCNQFDNGYEKWIPNSFEYAAIEALAKAKGEIL